VRFASTDRQRRRGQSYCGNVGAEFIEMPGLVLKPPQAARLWSVTATQAHAALTELVDGGFLVRDLRGVYRRRGLCHAARDEP
jgi:hypothetical protein